MSAVGKKQSVSCKDQYVILAVAANNNNTAQPH